jgi:hypothetical protein
VTGFSGLSWYLNAQRDKASEDIIARAKLVKLSIHSLRVRTWRLFLSSIFCFWFKGDMDLEQRVRSLEQRAKSSEEHDKVLEH